MTLPVQVPSDTDPQQLEMAAVLRGYRTESGRSLLALLDESPLLLITLRHFGYSFCRQTLDEVSVIEQIEAQSIRSVFVHLRSPERAKPYFDYYHLSDIERVSDPEASSVAAQKTFFSWYLVSRRLEGLATRCGSQTWYWHDQGRCRPNAPTIFNLRKRAIVRDYRYRTIAGQSDYLKLVV